MAVVRKVQSRIEKKPTLAPEVTRDQEEAVEAPRNASGNSRDDRSREGGVLSTRPKIRRCQFCSRKIEPHYWDSSALRRFVNDRGRIVSKLRSGTCSKHQRRVSKEIKRARHLAMIPFMIRA